MLLTWSVQSFGRAWLRLWRGLLLSFRQLRLVLEKDSEAPLDANLSKTAAIALDDAVASQYEEIKASNAERNNSFFEEEMEKLDNWAEDVKSGLEKELRDIDSEIKLRLKRINCQLFNRKPTRLSDQTFYTSDIQC